jgi:hypothetical protein
MHLGTLPAALAAGLIADAFFANGSLSWKASTPFDVRLVALHLGLAAVFWFAVGRGLETSAPSWRKAACSYVVVRLLTVPASLALEYDWWGLCCLLIMVTWIAIAVGLVVAGCRLMWVRHQSAIASAR